MKSLFRIFYIFTYLFFSVCHADLNLIDEFIGHEGINAMTMFHCGSPESIASLLDYSGSFLSIHLPSTEFYSDHHRLMTTGHHRFGLIADLSCPSMKDLLQFCSDRSYFNESYRWLLVNGEDTNDTFPFLESLNLNIDTHLTLAIQNPNSDEKGYELYEVYGTIHRRGGKNHVVQIGASSSRTDILWIDANYLYKRRTCLDGLSLRAVVTTPQRKYYRKSALLEKYLLNLDPPRGHTTDRLGFQMSTVLSKSLNFKMQLITADDWHFNELGTNSSKGVIGQLQNNLVDFSISLLSLGKERIAAYDITVPIYTARLMIVFRHPKNSASRNVFLLPFQNNVWVGVLTIMISTCIFLLAVSCTGKRKNFNASGEIIFTVLGFLSRQPSINESNLASARIMIIATIIFCFIIYQFYSTFIISSMLVLPTKDIRTLQDLLSSNLGVAIEDFGYNREFFKRTNDAVALKMYKEKIFPNKHGFTDVNTGIGLIQRGDYAFLMDCSYGYPLILESFDEHQICELHEINMFPSRPLYIPVPKGSPLKEIFRIVLRRAMETGTTDYYNRIFNSKRPSCTMNDFSFDQVKLDDIASLYWFLAMGGALGLGILVVEIIEFRIRTYLEMRYFLRKYPNWLD